MLTMRIQIKELLTEREKERDVSQEGICFNVVRCETTADLQDLENRISSDENDYKNLVRF